MSVKYLCEECRWELQHLDENVHNGKVLHPVYHTDYGGIDTV